MKQAHLKLKITVLLKKANYSSYAWKRYFKARNANHGTKIEVVQQNADRYSVSAMCKVLQPLRNTYYYHLCKKDKHEKQTAEADIEEHIFKIFQQICTDYGTRKIKKELTKQGLTVSRRRIGRLLTFHNS